MTRMYSIPEIYQRLGVKVDPKTSWKIGTEVRELWQRVKGYAPEFQLRPKANGGGTHLLAVYPEEWLPRIEERIKYYKHAPADQKKLDL